MTPTHFGRGLLSLAAAILLAASLGGCGFINTDAVGTWEGGLDGATLKFTGEGVITGNDGCLGLTGVWSESGSDVTLSMSPLLNPACPEAPAWVAGAETATINGESMAIFGHNKVHLGDLQRISRP